MIIPETGASIDVTMIPVESKMLHSFGYDATTSTLYARFIHGMKLYSYAGVPLDVFDAMRAAVSPGKAFNASIVKRYEGKFIKEVG